MTAAARLAGIVVSTAIGVALAGCTTSGITPVQQAEGAQRTYCQWSAEPGRKIVIFGDNIQAWKIDLRTLSPITIDVPNTTGRTSVKVTVPKGFAEDDTQKVSCKVGGEWKEAGTA